MEEFGINARRFNYDFAAPRVSIDRWSSRSAAVFNRKTGKRSFSGGCSSRSSN